MIEITPVGGMNEVGKNMTAVGIDGEYVIIDMGINLESILSFDEFELSEASRDELVRMNAIPDDSIIRGKRFLAVLLTHGHLDHVGALSKMISSYSVPVFGTPYTVGIVKRLMKEEGVHKTSERMLRAVPPDSIIRLGNLTVRFIPVKHSIPQTVAIKLEGESESVLFASDFKFDDGGKERDLIERSDVNGVSVSLVGSVRADEPGRTPPESEAKEMLREVMEDVNDSSHLIYVTTFSSHMERLSSIVDIAFDLGRTPVMVGRSLHSYCSIATELGLVRFPPELTIYGRPNTVRSELRDIEFNRRDYVVICTGHQGEPTSVLSRIADGRLPPRVEQGDHVIFSASVIPTPINRANREILEAKLEALGARIRRDVHVSGHARREDTKDFIDMIKPEHVIPCHGTPEKLRAVIDISSELGYDSRFLHLLKNGMTLRLGD
ncbi:MAG: MBL fold metallo-hydrolase [Candidatus Hadarchaeales archaeon]